MKHFIKEFIIFGLRQAQACLFGGLLLLIILLSKLIWRPDFVVARYDAIFVAAILIQVILVLTKLETIEEYKVIFIFHIVGTIMEIFKTSSTIGSWHYPEANLIRIGGVPLFSGFMYSAVGSYIARIWRIFEFKFTNYPDRRLTALLCALIYINFFTHHYTYDLRYFLFTFTAFLYYKTWIYFKPGNHYYRMPLLLGFFLVAFFIWIAENLGTFSATWTYASQHSIWDLVPFTKIGAWFQLMIISFVLVTLIHKDEDLHSNKE